MDIKAPLNIPDNPRTPARPLRIALVQHRRNRFDPPDNHKRMNQILPAIENVDLVLLPENWRGVKPMSGQELDENLAQWGDFAHKQNYTLLTGGTFIQRGDGIQDICHVIGPDAKVMGEVDKIFPSEPVGERAYLTGGERLPVFEAAGVKFGVLVCIDMMYPELARSLVQRGAEVIFNPANIPLARMGLWHALIRIRAAENTIFTVFSTNTGTTYPDFRNVLGHSAAAAPYGELIFEAGQAPGVHILELDLAEADALRTRWPYVKDLDSVHDFSGETVAFKSRTRA
jgi:predicted amidohydrolase